MRIELEVALRRLVACLGGLLVWLVGLGAPSSLLARTTPRSADGSNPRSADRLETGLFVEKVEKTSEAAKAHIQAGDILVAWCRGPERGEFYSSFDLFSVEIEQSPLGLVTIDGLRGPDHHVWVLGQDVWDVKTRPVFRGNLEETYKEGLRLANAGHLAEAAQRWREIAYRADDLQADWLPSWVDLRVAQMFADAKSWKEADEAYEKAARLSPDGVPAIRVQTLLEWSDNLMRYRQQPDQGVSHIEEARAIIGQSRTLLAAYVLSISGVFATAEGHLSEADTLLRDALEMDESLAPNSRAVAITESAIGGLRMTAGDLAGAETSILRSIAIFRRVAPDSGYLASTLLHLSLVPIARRDLVKGELYSRQALEFWKANYPHGSAVAYILNNLAVIANRRGNSEKAAEYYNEALKILQEKSPQRVDVGVVLGNLAGLSRDKSDLPKAESYARRSVLILDNLTPGGVSLVPVLTTLGEILQSEGRISEAEESFKRALTIQDKFAPASPDVAPILAGLGAVNRERGDLAAAERYEREALAVIEKTRPGSVEHAECLAALAKILRERQQPEAAAEMYERALTALESQTARLGGSEDQRAGFRARHRGLYKEYIDLLMSREKPELAFHVLERSRARSMLEVLTAAHARIDRRGDTTLLARERVLEESLNSKIDSRLRLLGGSHTPEQLSAVEKEISTLLDQYGDVEAEIRVKTPAYASLTQPRPLTLQEVQSQLLDEETLLLEYSLGEQRSFLFALTSRSLRTYELPKRSDIESLARELHASVQKTSSRGGTSVARETGRSSYSVKAAALSRLLLEPLAAVLGNKRLVIVADGSLQYVPFALLPEPSPRKRDPTQPLFVRHEIVSLPSASALAVTRREQRRTERPDRSVFVFADPVFDAADPRVSASKSTGTFAARGNAPDSELPPEWTRSASDVHLVRDGRGYLPRLPFTRREANAIVNSANLGTSRIALDFDAKRDLALGEELRHYRILHFATHTLLDNKHPELSGLVLSMVDENGGPVKGFLELEDIYNLDLAADLVVLSGCETALGKEVDGESLVGLTRGFMYAGASSVLSSLWKVDDYATSKLMKGFYEGMEGHGLRPAAALRRAQLSLWRQKHWSAPYYWAAFTLQGDWN